MWIGWGYRCNAKSLACPVAVRKTIISVVSWKWWQGFENWISRLLKMKNKKGDLRSIFFLRRGQTINQTTMAVSTEKPNEMSRVPHQGILSNPSTEGSPGAKDTIKHTQKENRERQFLKTRQRVLPFLVVNTKSCQKQQTYNWAIL